MDEATLGGGRDREKGRGGVCSVLLHDSSSLQAGNKTLDVWGLVVRKLESVLTWDQFPCENEGGREGDGYGRGAGDNNEFGSIFF